MRVEEAPLSADQRRRAWVITAGLLTGSVVILAAALFVRRLIVPTGPAIVSWLAVAFAVLSPGVAALFGRTGARGSQPGVNPGEAALIRHLRTSALLEGAAIFCAVALVAGPEVWPLVAAAVPITALVVRLPRAA